MDAPFVVRILKELVDSAGGSRERGYILAIHREELQPVPASITTPEASYAVVCPGSEVALRHMLWKAAGAPILALLKEDLARRLPPDLIRRAQNERVHALDTNELLSVLLQVPVIGSDDQATQELALSNVDAIRHLIGQRTLPTVVDRRLLDELLLDVVTNKRLREATAPKLLAEWLAKKPQWSPLVWDLVRRGLPVLHAMEGKLLAWASKESDGLGTLIVHGVLLALEGDLPQTVWGTLWRAGYSSDLEMTQEALRATLVELTREALDELGRDAPAVAAELLKKAESLGRRHLTPSQLAQSQDLPLGLDNRCDSLAKQMGEGEAVPSNAIESMRRHRSARMRRSEIDVLDEMARLSRYLSEPESKPDATVLERVTSYQDHSAFADVAAARLRRALAASTSHHHAANEVLGRYRARRDGENLAFASILAAGYRKALYTPEVVSLDRLWNHGQLRGLQSVESPIYAVVLDGCSYPVFIELLLELSQSVGEPIGLRVSADTGRAAGIPSLAPLPTITSHSRGAIFLGDIPKDPWIAETVWRDRKEAQSDPARFKQNKALGMRSRRLFLKGDLADGGHELIAALADPALDVVAVVFNAVDDQIGSSNTGAMVQVKAEQINALVPSLRAALRAKRNVLVTADHGHSVFWNKKLRVGEGSTPRYRVLADGDAIPDGFLEIDLSRLGGDDGRRAFAWKMGAYQGLPQVGFHGGCSLEEMVVPLAWLVSGGVAADEPSWWYGRGEEEALELVAPTPPVQEKAKQKPPAKPPVVQGDLFEGRPLNEVRAELIGKLGLAASVVAVLEIDEKAALVVLFENKSARVRELASALKRPEGRMPGFMTRLYRKLHEAKAPCLRKETLPDGEDQYHYVAEPDPRP